MSGDGHKNMPASAASAGAKAIAANETRVKMKEMRQRINRFSAWSA
jgi:hypothetical protein